MGKENPGACHSVGECVVYRGSGIYRIDDIRDEDFCGLGRRTYYVLSSVFDHSSVIFVPLDAKDIEKTLRNVLSCDQIDEVIAKAGENPVEWVEDVKSRAEYFDRLLTEGCCSDIIGIYIKMMKYKDSIESGRKKLYASDAKILAAAERIITDEFSFVLAIPKSEVLGYISARLSPSA